MTVSAVPAVLLSGNHANIQRWRLARKFKTYLSTSPRFISVCAFKCEQRRLLVQLKKEQAKDDLGQSNS
jgi:tRNA (guanine37-N1)-methyltransferase